MHQLRARCRSCGANVTLEELAGAGDGLCHGCNQPFSEQWTMLLVEECAAVEQLSQALLRSLRRLTGLPGNLELQPDELFANLRDEVPWGQSIDNESQLVAAEIERLTRRLDDGHITADIADDLSRLANRLTGLATILEAHQEATDPGNRGAGQVALANARHLDDAVNGIRDGTADPQAVRRRLQAAADSV